jgi:sulfur-oxidizing protein SoxB
LTGSSIDLEGRVGERIADMQLDDGSRIEAAKIYKVAGRATVGSESTGAPIWDVVANYLRGSDTAAIKKSNTPKLKNVAGNSGIA